MSISNSPPMPPRSKKRRINFACNYCRARKTRCDERKPSCNACQAAGVRCITTDKRRPGKLVDRQQAGRQRHSIASTQGDLPLESPVNQLVSEDGSGEQFMSDCHSQLNFRATQRYPDVACTDDAEGQAEILSSHDANEGESSVTRLSISRFQGRLPLVRKTIGSSSVEMASDWLDLALYRLGLRQTPTKPLEYLSGSMLSSSEATLLKEWDLPNPESAKELVDCFFQGPNMVFPLMERKDCTAAFEACFNSSFLEFGQRFGPVQLLQILAVMILGYISSPHQIFAFDVKCYMNRCRTILGHAMTYQTTSSLKALMLFSMALKCANEIVEAWHIINLAASIATSLGLNRLSSRVGSTERTSIEYSKSQAKKKVWVYLYTLEKLLAFEIGRQSNIPDIMESEIPDELECKELYALATLLSATGKRSVVVSIEEDERDREDELYESIREKVKITGESCLKLIKWAESVPDEFRPTSDSGYNSRTHPVASYISMQYNSALLISNEALQSAVDIIAKDKPWYFVIRNGQSMAADAARKILRLVIEGLDLGINTAMSSLTPPLNSISTLAVSIINRPQSHAAGMDLSLIETAASALRELNCGSFGNDQGLGLLLDRLVRLARDSIKTPTYSRALASPAEIGESRITLQPAPLGDRSDPQADESDEVASIDWTSLVSPPQPQQHRPTDVTFNNEPQLGILEEDPMWLENWTPNFPDEISWDWSCFPQLFQARARSDSPEQM